jgi:hypothetical protein
MPSKKINKPLVFQLFLKNIILFMQEIEKKELKSLSQNTLKGIEGKQQVIFKIHEYGKFLDSSLETFCNKLLCNRILAYLDKKREGLYKKAEKGSVKKLIQTLFTLIPKDENVLFFIVKHKSCLDQFMGRGFVKKQVMTLFSKKEEQLTHFIVQRYKKRGFEDKIPFIEKTLAAL